MNYFSVICPGCGALYNDVVENVKTKLLHRGLQSTTDKSELPTSNCIAYHDYIIFNCGHCCPDVFDACRACRLGHPKALDPPGHQLSERKECYCHYCHQHVDRDEPVGINAAAVSVDIHEKQLNELIAQHTENYQELEKQRSQFGIDPPLHIINGMKAEMRKINRLKKKLAKIKSPQ